MSSQLEDILKSADRGIDPSDPSLLADRVLLTIQRRRRVKAVSALVLIGGLTGVLLMNLPKAPAPELVMNPPQPMKRSVESDLDQIDREIALREATVRTLEALQRQRAVASRLSMIPATSPEDQIIERAAAAVVFQADRVLSQGEAQSAAKAYHEVIAYFPQATSAQTARQRIAQFDKAG